MIYSWPGYLLAFLLQLFFSNHYSIFIRGRCQMVTVRFFAVLRKLTGREDFHFSLPQPITLKEVFDQIEKEIPQIRTILKDGRALIAINQEMADENTLVRDGDEIALLPPFAGG